MIVNKHYGRSVAGLRRALMAKDKLTLGNAVENSCERLFDSVVLQDYRTGLNFPALIYAGFFM